MKAAELRQSILQAAVQGKLVPQNPHDELACELLKRIQQKKAQLVKNGKIKKEKPLPPIKEDEMPCDLPEGWVWTRVTDIAIVNPRNCLPDNTVVSFLPMNLISQDYFGGHQQETRPWAAVKKGFTHFAENDVLIAKITPCFQNGKSCIAHNLKSGYGAGTTELHVLRAIEVLPQYLLIFVKSPKFLETCAKNMTGTAGQQRVPTDYLMNYLVPLPPLNEQQRIAAKVDKLMALCDELEAEEKKLSALEAHFVEYLPKAILQSAVQGRLVPQNSCDEPALELLKRIQHRKAQLVKEGKLKKGKSLPSVADDEIPYDLPEGWEWCRLCDVGQIIGGATPDSQESSYYTEPGQGIAWLTPADMTKFTQNKYINHGAKDITEAGYNSCSTMLMPPDSIIFSSRAPIGHIAFSGKELCTNQGFKSVVPYMTTVAPWIFYTLKSKVDDIQSRASGTTFKEVSGKFMESEIIPLPPLAEQQRIVAKVDKLMALCDELKSAYTTPVELSKSRDVIPFPAVEPVEETLLAARGNVEQLSDEAMQAIDDLFAEDEE